MNNFQFLHAEWPHRMLSARGNPSMDNLAAIFDAVRGNLKVGIKVRTVEAA